MEQYYHVNTIELQKIMIERGLSKIKDLSDESGVDRNTLAKVVYGKQLPSANVMYKITRALGMSGSQAGLIFFVPNLPNR